MGTESPPGRNTLLVMLLVALAMVFGGGGSSHPLTELIIEAGFAAVVLVQVLSPPSGPSPGRPPLFAIALGALVLVVPVLQLVPLPPSVWQSLPGRSVEVQSVALTGQAGAWMPWSMVPARTFASLLSMVAPVVLLLEVARLDLGGRTWACATVLALVGASIVLGVLQLSHTGGMTWSLYSDYHRGYLVGFHGNRNAETDVLQIGLLALCVLVSTRLSGSGSGVVTWVVLALGMPLILFAVFLAGSRAGLGILPVTLLFSLAILWPPVRKRVPNARLWIGGIAVGTGAIALLLTRVEAVQKVLGRFDVTHFAHEARPDLWADTVYAIKQVWPAGGGIGSFIPLFEAAEQLEMVDPTAPVRAHNEWLEFALEAGLPGIIVLTAIALLLCWIAYRALGSARARHAPAALRGQVLFGLGALAIAGLHAFVDYPMRSMALASLAALAAGMLMPLPATRVR
ncbi:MAG: O-antigen ligase family protein [Sphingomonadales bacterium]|nr:O-antigen ligase family protein [Sphingomonadales bacterium]MDE2567951.1 O-antigen ligase family protein [Sphingomonadales bacterium]